MAKKVQTIEEELVSVVCRSVNGLQQEMSLVGVLVLLETLADMLEIPVGTKSGELLEVTTKNHHRAVRKLPNRMPKSFELSVVVLGDLVADEEVVPEQQKKNKNLHTRRTSLAADHESTTRKPSKLKQKKPSLEERKQK